MAFQKFANKNGYTPKLKEDGAWGPKTSAAWDSLKTKWFASQNVAKSTSATDLLAGDINSLNGRTIIAGGVGKYYNMQDELVGTASQGNRMGVVYNSQKYGNYYKVFFKGYNGVKYYTYASNIRVI